MGAIAPGGDAQRPQSQSAAVTPKPNARLFCRRAASVHHAALTFGLLVWFAHSVLIHMYFSFAVYRVCGYAGGLVVHGV